MGSEGEETGAVSRRYRRYLPRKTAVATLQKAAEKVADRFDVHRTVWHHSARTFRPTVAW